MPALWITSMIVGEAKESRLRSVMATEFILHAVYAVRRSARAVHMRVLS
jgi:hypothetical protein